MEDLNYNATPPEKQEKEKLDVNVPQPEAETSGSNTAYGNDVKEGGRESETTA